MARFHAVALGPKSARVVANVALLASVVLVAACASAPWMPGGSEQQFSGRHLIYLETSEFRWVDASERQQLACANGTTVICSAATGRLSLANCGCLPPR